MKVPDEICLQWYGDYDPELLSETERDEIDPTSASWCWEQIFPHDIEYIRRDAVDAVLSDLLLYVAQGHDASSISLYEAKARIIAGIDRLAGNHGQP